VGSLVAVLPQLLEKHCYAARIALLLGRQQRWENQLASGFLHSWGNLVLAPLPLVEAGALLGRFGPAHAWETVLVKPRAGHAHGLASVPGSGTAAVPGPASPHLPAGHSVMVGRAMHGLRRARQAAHPAAVHWLRSSSLAA